MAGPTPWSDNLVEELRRLWADGFSAGEIARELGRGWTRSGILGKIHRLGLQRRLPEKSSKPLHAKAVVRVRTMRRRPVFVAATPPKKEPPRQPIEVRPLRLLELGERQCRWPLGELYERAEFFCAADCESGAQYCSHHMRKAFSGR